MIPCAAYDVSLNLLLVRTHLHTSLSQWQSFDFFFIGFVSVKMMHSHRNTHTHIHTHIHRGRERASTLIRLIKLSNSSHNCLSLSPIPFQCNKLLVVSIYTVQHFDKKKNLSTPHRPIMGANDGRRKTPKRFFKAGAENWETVLYIFLLEVKF